MKKHRNLMILIILAIFLSMLILIVWQIYHKNSRTMPEKSVVEIIGAGSGNGVIWQEKDDEYIVATVAHVLGQDALQGNIPEYMMIGGVQTEIIDQYVSADFDLAFVRFRMPEKSRTAPFPVACRELSAYDALEPEDTLYIYGFWGGEAKAYEGKVRSSWIYMEDFGYHMLWGEAADVRGGMSGSGVFDEEGKLIGILCGGNGDNEIAVLPINIMETEWKNSGMAY